MSFTLTDNLLHYFSRYPKTRARFEKVLQTRFSDDFRVEEVNGYFRLFEKNVLVDSTEPNFFPPAEKEPDNAKIVFVNGFGLGCLFQQVLQKSSPAAEEYIVVEPSIPRFLFSLSQTQLMDIIDHPKIHWLVGLESAALGNEFVELLSNANRLPVARYYHIQNHPKIGELHPGYFAEVRKYWESILKGDTNFSFLSSDLSCLDISPNRLAADDLERLGRDWNLRSFFGHIKIISSDSRSRRFTQCKRELEKVGLQPFDYEIAPGVNGAELEESIWCRMETLDEEPLPDDSLRRRKQGQAGCYMAHYRAIKAASDLYDAARLKFDELRMSQGASIEKVLAAADEVKKYSSVLIIEDNTGFGRLTPEGAVVRGEGIRLREVLRELPDDWDMFYFVTSCGAQKVGKMLAKLDYGLTTKCYAVHSRMYKRLLLKLGAIVTEGVPLQPVDHHIASLHGKAHCYSPIEPFAYRLASASEVCGFDRTNFHYQWQIEIRD